MSHHHIVPKHMLCCTLFDVTKDFPPNINFASLQFSIFQSLTSSDFPQFLLHTISTHSPTLSDGGGASRGGGRGGDSSSNKFVGDGTDLLPLAMFGQLEIISSSSFLIALALSALSLPLRSACGRMCVYVLVCMHMCICVYVCVCVRVCVCVCVYTHVYMLYACISSQMYVCDMIYAWGHVHKFCWGSQLC